ncbi:SPOR domain-containing protein [Mucilaginibacter aquatilis]|uniref:SPOR domain-containing protein n=1 Tax=Mucilaginibacter aquatilis TaxID=1517760 RepID=A0A6I4I3X4_9SPHI|nr:SPOR domain-containing protein [Mucilaginibacter aquatilis]MVN89740.1 hypothetical protein [Mucilaginibacter aquatilis]
MDLSVYISELLNERGNIGIPDIGVFKQVRKRGYYNAEEGKLYPPYFATEFEQTTVSDDVLLQYLTEKSKVSVSSAKFFLDRFVQNTLQQAEIGEARIGNLGWLSKEVDTLHFRSASETTEATAAFGFAPVSLLKKGPESSAAQSTEPKLDAEPENSATASEETIQPVPVTFSIEKELGKAPEALNESPVAKPQTTTSISPLVRQPKPVQHKAEQPAPVVPQPQPEVPQVQKTEALPVADNNDEVPARPFYMRLPFYLGLVLVIAAAAVIMILKNTANDNTRKATDHSEKASPSMDSVKVNTPAPSDTVIIKAPAATDTVARNTALPESTEYAPEVETPTVGARTVVNSNHYNYVLVGGSYGTLELAKAASERYKAVGIGASPFENSRKLFKVALGYYPTYTEGQEAKKQLVKQGKVLNWKLYVETLRK